MKRFNVDQLSGFSLNGAKVYGENIGAAIFKSNLNTGVTHQTASDPVVLGKGAHKIPEQLYTLSHVFVLYIPKNYNHNHNHNHTYNLCPCLSQFDFSTLIKLSLSSSQRNIISRNSGHMRCDVVSLVFRC